MNDNKTDNLPITIERCCRMLKANNKRLGKHIGNPDHICITTDEKLIDRIQELHTKSIPPLNYEKVMTNNEAADILTSMLNSIQYARGNGKSLALYTKIEAVCTAIEVLRNTPD